MAQEGRKESDVPHEDHYVVHLDIRQCAEEATKQQKRSQFSLKKKKKENQQKSTELHCQTEEQLALLGASPSPHSPDFSTALAQQLPIPTVSFHPSAPYFLFFQTYHTNIGAWKYFWWLNVLF